MLGAEACTRRAPTRLWRRSQEDFKAQYFLWQLLCIENDVRRARAEAVRRRAEAERADEGLEGVEREVAAKRKQAAGIHKQRALLERKVAKRRAEMEKKVLCHGRRAVTAFARVVVYGAMLVQAVLLNICAQWQGKRCPNAARS